MKARVPTEQGKARTISMRTEAIRSPSSVSATVGGGGEQKSILPRNLKPELQLERETLAKIKVSAYLKVLCGELNLLKGCRV